MLNKSKQYKLKRSTRHIITELLKLKTESWKQQECSFQESANQNHSEICFTSTRIAVVKTNKDKQQNNFPVRPVAKTLHFHCRGPQVRSLVGEPEILPAAQCGPKQKLTSAGEDGQWKPSYTACGNENCQPLFNKSLVVPKQGKCRITIWLSKSTPR